MPRLASESIAGLADREFEYLAGRQGPEPSSEQIQRLSSYRYTTSQQRESRGRSQPRRKSDRNLSIYDSAVPNRSIKQSPGRVVAEFDPGFVLLSAASNTAQNVSKSHSSQPPGATIEASNIEFAIKRSDHVQGLLSKCGSLNHSRKLARAYSTGQLGPVSIGWNSRIRTWVSSAPKAGAQFEP